MVPRRRCLNDMEARACAAGVLRCDIEGSTSLVEDVLALPARAGIDRAMADIGVSMIRMESQVITQPVEAIERLPSSIHPLDDAIVAQVRKIIVRLDGVGGRLPARCQSLDTWKIRIEG